MTGRWKRLFRGSSFDAELREELDSHLRMRTELNRSEGMSETDAQLDARRRFGNRMLIQEETRAVSVNGLVDNVGQDMRYAMRSLLGTPGVVLVSVLSLGLGIGANLTLFAGIRNIFLEPPTAANLDELVVVEPGNSNQFSFLNYRDLRDSAIFQTSSVIGIQTLTFATAKLLPEFVARR